MPAVEEHILERFSDLGFSDPDLVNRFSDAGMHYFDVNAFLKFTEFSDPEDMLHCWSLGLSAHAVSVFRNAGISEISEMVELQSSGLEASKISAYESLGISTIEGMKFCSQHEVLLPGAIRGRTNYKIWDSVRSYLCYQYGILDWGLLLRLFAIVPRPTTVTEILRFNPSLATRLRSLDDGQLKTVVSLAEEQPTSPEDLTALIAAFV